MSQQAEIFAKYYKEYQERVAAMDLSSVADKLGLEKAEGGYLLPLYGRNYIASGKGLVEESGKKPDYMACIILARYLTLCPDEAPFMDEWAAFKDFKKTSHFTNVNYFNSDTERALAANFGGKMDDLKRACNALSGQPDDSGLSYDLVKRFQALPKISVLLLFNDVEGRFPAFGTVLFQKHTEYYLDPESIAVTSAYLVRSLKALAFEPAP
ncbi:protein of unknown function [Desulfatibacillum alkenivorans DSM 16219]|jgi:thiol-disulfide isomerase/thioredoxin|uniref:DUF3786 domain-containing protein n=1 Tax=Desulfatibacillum alkenivorans DSM 16219 TaxID=1121393 RepID=A0A1M6JXC8_9BACT|nr:DUF3786 domain-containing protein [Desulfatibacillum alkenivorans]SHJ51308.1 protein of unknown function [Desulfatibacillum alkenivorans DSM 16219]